MHKLNFRRWDFRSNWFDQAIGIERSKWIVSPVSLIHVYRGSEGSAVHPPSIAINTNCDGMLHHQPMLTRHTTGLSKLATVLLNDTKPTKEDQQPDQLTNWLVLRDTGEIWEICSSILRLINCLRSDPLMATLVITQTLKYCWSADSLIGMPGRQTRLQVRAVSRLWSPLSVSPSQVSSQVSSAYTVSSPENVNREPISPTFNFWWDPKHFEYFRFSYRDYY